MSAESMSDLEFCQEIEEFLQGCVPEGYRIHKKGVPKLTKEQAQTVLWFLGNQYREIPDHVHPCCMCGDLFDKDDSGDCLDFGKAPYFFCDSCMETDKYHRKLHSRLNPDRPPKENL